VFGQSQLGDNNGLETDNGATIANVGIVFEAPNYMSIDSLEVLNPTHSSLA
jgi:hypothetical protein